MVIKLDIVKGIIKHNKKYLLLQKSQDYEQSNIGKFECPGGTIERGETPRKAILRETLKETGLKCKIVKELPTIQIKTKEVNSKCKVYLLEATSDQVKLSDEHSSYAWLQAEEVEQKQLAQFVSLLLEYFNNPEKYLN